MSWFTDLFVASTPAGVASETAHAAVTGVFDGVTKLIEEFHLSPDQEIKAKIAVSQMQLQTVQTFIADTQSARQMEVMTRSNMPAILAVFYTTSFIGISFALLYLSYYYPEITFNAFQAGMIGAVWGALAKEAAMASTFYFGTTDTSGDKNSTITDLVKQVGNK